MCIFLTEDNLCRIHRDLGESAKPLVCRLFPFQLVPLEDFAYVTLRQYCPSAAAERGRRLGELSRLLAWYA
jgi:lysine-N-methylase